MRKRITSTLLLFCTVLLLFSLLPVAAQAETEGDWEYSVNSGLATITKYNGTDAEVTIPDAFGLYQVAAIGKGAFEGNVTMTQVNFPKGLTSIGENAFKGCAGLTEVTLPAKLTTLEARAFENCTWLTKIVIQCTSLNDIDESYSLYGQPFRGAGTAGDGIAVEFAEGCTRVPKRLFNARDGVEAAPNITSVTMADTVTWVGDDAFQGCANLETVTFSQKLTAIAANAFSNCSALQDVELPKSLTDIGEKAFHACTSFETITLPEKLVNLGARAFQGCTYVTEITIKSASLNDISEDYSLYGQPFYGVGISGDGVEVSFEKGCTRVPKRLFHARDGVASVANITSVTMADSVTWVGDSAFQGCTGLETVTLSKKLTSIAAYAFDDCSALQDVEFPKVLTDIGECAFRACTSMETITLPEKLVNLGARAFQGCTYVTEITIKSTSLNDISEDYSLYGQPFYGVGTAADGITVAFADGCTRVPKRLFHARDGVTSAANITSVTLADSVTWIGEYAFQGCANLETLTLSAKLTAIHNNAFSDCTNLQDVDFPKSLTDIGEYAFKSCTSLETVTLPEKLTNLGARAFQDCTYITKISIKSTSLNDIAEEYSLYGQPFYGAGTAGTGIEVIFEEGCTRVPRRLFHARDGATSAANVTSVTMADTVTWVGGNSFQECVYLETVDFGNGVTYIGEDSFQGTKNLKTITLSNNLTTIAKNAFNGCTKLQDVTFPESLTEIAEGAFRGCSGFESITLPTKLATLGARAFQECINVAKITIKATSLNDISEDYSLYGQPFYSVGTATEGVAVEFAEGCTKVPRKLFHVRDGASSAANVTSVTMADTVTWVGGSAFQGCAYLQTVDFGNGVTYIGEDSFHDCASLEEVTFSNNLTTIAKYAFGGCAKLKDVTFPDAITEIAEGAFWGCYAFESITLPEKLATLGARAFQECINVTKITVKSTRLNNISEDYSLYGQPFYSAGTAGAGIEVIFADGCTRIPANLFHGRDGVAYAPVITSIDVADTVTEIGRNAFTNCGELDTLRFKGNAPSIADNAFTGVIATGYHPGWPISALQDYGGDITWEGYVPDDTCDHTDFETLNEQDATCIEEGYTGDLVCTACGEIIESGEPIPVVDHVTELENALDATCMEEGYTGDWICVVCREVIEAGETIPVADHETELYNAMDATCVVEGYTGDWICVVCGETVETGEVIPAADHETQLEGTMDATCTEAGYTGEWICVNCRSVIEDGEVIPATGHAWDDGEVTREPTPTEPGEMTFTCTNPGCGEVRTEEIAPSACAHTNTERQNAVEATCTEEGYTGDTVCADCGETLTTGETIPAKGHTEVVDEAKAPTCKETGLTEGKHCSVCGEVLVKQEILDKLEHDFEDGTCTDCGAKDPDWEEPTEPTDPDDPTDPTEPEDEPVGNLDVIRIAGTNRFETAFKVADQMKKNMGVEKFDAIIVASGLNFPDALSGSYLAAVKQAPILLSFNDAYNDQAKNYIRENLSDDGIVYLLGSSDVVPVSFEEDLEGFNVKRLAGPNRFDTNLEILKEVGVEGKEILVCSGLGFADSLSASATELPILLVWNNLFENQKAFLEEYAAGGKFCIIGGETAVSKQLENQVAAYGETRRVGGTNRFMTSVMIAQTFFDAPESAVLAYAWNYPDGLCGGALASTMSAPLVLTMTKYENAAMGYIRTEGIAKGAVLGGTGLISDESVKMIFGEPQKPAGYTVTFDSMGGSPVASQTVEEGKAAKAPVEPTREGYAFLGWYLEKKPENFQDGFRFESTEITGDITLYAAWLSTADTDGDQLADGLEEYYGTDIHDPDTDDDTVSDYIEVVLLGTDPLKADAHQDTDGDTLSNAREIELGTDPSSADSDLDGLADNEELDLGTDPMKQDTDGDGVSDGKEVELGTNPLAAESSFSVAVTADTDDTVTASVQMTLSGQQVESLAVEPILDTHLFPEEMPGYMGQAYDFRVEGEFESAIIRFEFDPSTLGEGETPAIFYFNEAEQELEELETTVEGNIATAEVTHFSTYVLINSTVYYDAFAWEDVWESDSVYDAVELVFAIDDSGSMGPVGANNDPKNLRLSVARDLVDKLPGNSKIGVVWFAEEGTMLTPELITDRDAAKELLTTKYFKSAACNHTSMYDGIQVSFDLFQSTDDAVLKMLVVLSDGIADDTRLHNSVIDTALANNVKIYSVGLGSSTSYFTSYMKPLAEQTGGSFYLASQADELAEIYADINKEIDLQTNSDEDSIPDYYEDNMYSFNGMKIEMDKTKADTDGDGLKDDEEIEFSLKYNEDKTKVYVKGKLKSYPHLEDSDNDAILDPDDPKPMEYTITDRTLAFVEGLSYSDLKPYVGKTVGQAIEAGAKVDNLSTEHAEYLKDAVIVHANNSGYYDWLDILKTDKGLGSIALKFVRKTEPTAVIFAIRGTEPTKDLVNDAVTDVDLGFSWSSKQSEIAFKEYKSIATNKEYDYYVTGHSLGGRLAQDVLYKVHNANEGGLFKKKANIPTPVHSATFNALGYNRAVYITLENDILAEYKNKLTNYYYWQDLVGETLGATVLFDRAGTDVLLEGRNADKSYFRGDKRSDNTWLYVPDVTYHGILNFHTDYDLFYTSPHTFSYWAD